MAKKDTDRGSFIHSLVGAIMAGIVVTKIRGTVESWPTDGRFLFSCALVLVGWLILRRVNRNRYKHRALYHYIGTVVFGVGFWFLFNPVWEQIFSDS